MAYILENDVLKLECAGKGGEMLHLVKKSTDHETLYQGDQGWSGRNPSLFPSNLYPISKWKLKGY